MRLRVNAATPPGKAMPRPIVWGGRLNLQFAGGTAVSRRASGFLVTEACTQRSVAIRLGEKSAQPSTHPTTDNPGHLDIGSYDLVRESASSIGVGVRPTAGIAAPRSGVVTHSSIAQICACLVASTA